MYWPNRNIFFKTDFTDNSGNVKNWECLNQINNRTTRSNSFELMPLYESPLPLIKGKYDDLQSLKPIIENNYHAFYNNLPHSDVQKKRKTV